jgi:single-strand DNA-binding protein
MRQSAAPKGATTMLDTQVTVVGNVVTDPKMNLTKDLQPFTTFRIASTPRRFDRSSGQWRDGDTSFLGVTCWRGLAENTAACVKKGQTVIVVGRLSVRLYETREGQQRQSTEIDAAAVGPDLGRVIAFVKRAERSLPAAPDHSVEAGEPGEGGDTGEPGELSDLDSIDWSYAAQLGSSAEDAAESSAEVPVDAGELPVEVPVPALVPVLVGAGGRSKGRSGGS